VKYGGGSVNVGAAMPPFTQLEMFTHGLKGMKVNFNIFPDQNNHQI
jgi:hypothetical protein